MAESPENAIHDWLDRNCPDLETMSGEDLSAGFATSDSASTQPLPPTLVVLSRPIRRQSLRN
jgi:hypothetical protein